MSKTPPELEWYCPEHGLQCITRMYTTAGSCPECKGLDVNPEANQVLKMAGEHRCADAIRHAVDLALKQGRREGREEGVADDRAEIERLTEIRKLKDNHIGTLEAEIERLRAKYDKKQEVATAWKERAEAAELRMGEAERNERDVMLKLEAAEAKLAEAQAVLASRDRFHAADLATVEAMRAAIAAERTKTAEAQPWRRCADALADEVAVLVQRGVIDSRSPAADALLDYREPPSTPRSDRLAAAEARTAKLDELGRAAHNRANAATELYKSEKDRIAKLVEALEKVPHPHERGVAGCNLCAILAAAKASEPAPAPAPAPDLCSHGHDRTVRHFCTDDVPKPGVNTRIEDRGSADQGGYYLRRKPR